MARLLRHGRLHFAAIASCITACYPATSRQVYAQVTALSIAVSARSWPHHIAAWGHMAGNCYVKGRA